MTPESQRIAIAEACGAQWVKAYANNFRHLVGDDCPRPALDVDFVQAEPAGRGHLHSRQFNVSPAGPDGRDGLRVETRLAGQGAPCAPTAILADVVEASHGDAVVLVHVRDRAVGRLPARLALVALAQHPEGDRLAEHRRIGEERLLAAIGHQLLKETAVNVGRLLFYGHGEGLFFIGLFHPLNDQAGQVQHGQVLFVLAVQERGAAPNPGAVAHASSRRKPSSQGTLVPERSSWLTTALTRLQTAWENPCITLHNVQF